MNFDSDFKLSKGLIEYRDRKRSVYSSEEGKKELFNLLYDLGMFRPISADMVDRYNYAVAKMSELGMLDECVVRRMLSMFFDSNPTTDERHRLHLQGEGIDEKGYDPFEIKEN